PAVAPVADTGAADAATAAQDAQGDVAAAAAEPAPAPAAAIPPPAGPEPRPGTDFSVIDPPMPLSPSPGRIEVAEVFSYTCIHCASIQTKVTPWKAALPADVEFRYVPMAHGAVEPIARAFYAAQA